MTSISNETAVAIVFGIITTIVGVLAWLDGRRRSRERGTTPPSLAASECTAADRSFDVAPDPENAELTQRVGDVTRRETDRSNSESSFEGQVMIGTRLMDHPRELLVLHLVGCMP
jgi:hypothetical protein